MKIVEVRTEAEQKRFNTLPKLIYRNDPKWIQPLTKDIEGVFDAKQNPAFEQGEAVRWILLCNKNETIGRVAAFYNKKHFQNMQYPVGGMGFFECINDKEAAFKLFDACKQWLESKGLKGMDGPINFGERDRFWGLLIESEEPPTYMEAYNPPYYKEFFQDYGFQVYFEQHTYGMDKKDFNVERVRKIAEWIRQKGNYRFEHFKLSEIDRFAADFVQIYNTAWERFENFKPVTKEEILKVFESLKPIVVEDFIWFAYVNNEPAGFIVMVPDVNQLFRYVNGKLDLMGKLKFLWHRQRGEMNKVKGLVFGVTPKYHNLGLDSVLAYQFAQAAYDNPQYQTAEIAWVGDFNPKMESLMRSMTGRVVKVHRTYRKYFDPSIPFESHAKIVYDK